MILTIRPLTVFATTPGQMQTIMVRLMTARKLSISSKMNRKISRTLLIGLAITAPDGFRYYTWTDANHNGAFDDGEETVHFIKDEPENQQNFANWFSYYRKREYVVKTVYGVWIAIFSMVEVGWRRSI